MSGKKTEYRITDFTIKSKSGQETEIPGFTMLTSDNERALRLFNEWKEATVKNLKKTGFVFGDKKPTLLKIEVSVIA